MDAARANNFNVLRLAAASLVVLAHAYNLRNEPDLLYNLLGRNFGWAAVSVFFVISGHLITNSLLRSPGLWRFATARALRIFPGLLVCILVTVIGLGLFVSTVPLTEYLNSPVTEAFVLGNARLSVRHELPGVFLTNPYPVVNGSLWTLRFEVYYYTIIAVLWAAGLLRGRSVRVLVMLLVLASYAAISVVAHGPEVQSLLGLVDTIRLGFCFFLGALFSFVGGSVRVRGWQVALLVGLAMFARGGPFLDVTLNLALAALTFWLAYLPNGLLRRMSTLPDYSYGVYIYAYPIQQVLLMTWPELPPLWHCGLALALVIPPAALSWHLVEKPALRLKNMFKQPAHGAAAGRHPVDRNTGGHFVPDLVRQPDGP